MRLLGCTNAYAQVKVSSNVRGNTTTSTSNNIKLGLVVSQILLTLDVNGGIKQIKELVLQDSNFLKSTIRNGLECVIVSYTFIKLYIETSVHGTSTSFHCKIKLRNSLNISAISLTYSSLNNKSL